MKFKLSISCLIIFGFVAQMFLYPVPASANRSWVADWIKTQKLNKQSIVYKDLYQSNRELLEDQDQIILGNLLAQYGEVPISRLSHSQVTGKNGEVIDQVKLSSKGQSAIVELSETEDGQILVKLTSAAKGKDLQFRFYPERMSVSDVESFLKRADTKFEPQLLNPTPSLVMLSQKELKLLTETQKKDYFQALQATINAAQKVSASIQFKKKGASLWQQMVNEAVAASAPSCVLGGWVGTSRVELGLAFCDVSDKRAKSNSCNGGGEVACSPLVFGPDAGCTGLTGEPCRSDSTDWNEFFTAYAERVDTDSSGNIKNDSVTGQARQVKSTFDQAKNQVSQALRDLIHICETRSAPTASSSRLVPGSLLWPQAHADQTAGANEQEASPVPAAPPTPVASEQTSPTPAPVTDNQSSRTVVTVQAGACAELQARLRNLERITCQNLSADTRAKLSDCNSNTAAPVRDAVTRVTQNVRSNWPLVVGAGLLGFLLGYALKKRKKKVVTKEVLVPNPIPGNPILVPNPIPGNPILVPNPIPGNPVPVPVPVPVPDPVPVPVPVPGAPYTPPVRGVI